MAILKLHQAVDGTELNIASDQIREVRDYPAGQCAIFLKDGTLYQPSESVEEVTKLWEKAEAK